jgi:hypothetical protein
MPFELRVAVTGLCLFAPEHGASNLHILMPKTMGSDLHVPALVFDPAYHTDPRYDPRPPAPRRLWGTIIDGYAVELPDTNSVGPDPAIPPGVVDLTRASAGKKVDPAHLSASPGSGSPVASRVTLRRATAVCRARGHLWSVANDPNPVYMDWMVEWSIRGIVGDTLSLNFHALGGSGAPDRPSIILRAIDGQIKLRVFHMPKTLPPGPPRPPKPGDRLKHLDMFCSLLTGGDSGSSVCVDARYLGRSPEPEEPCPTWPVFGEIDYYRHRPGQQAVPEAGPSRGDPYTCVPTRAEIA